jgi:membrane protease YdiL (CAAX protease family)
MGMAPTFERDVLPIHPAGVPHKRRWLGHVRPEDGRGIGAIILLCLLGLILFAEPIFRLSIVLVSGFPESDGDIDLSRGVLLLVFLVNTTIFILLPVLYLWLIYPRQSWSMMVDELRARLEPMTAVWALVGAAVTFAFMVIMGLVLTGLVDMGWMEEPETSELVLALQPQLTLFLVIAIPLTAAVTEEVFFRGILQPRVGLVVSSLLFGLVHIGYGTWLQIVAPVVLGLFFGLMYRFTKTLWAPIAGHFTFDFVQLLGLYLTR